LWLGRYDLLSPYVQQYAIKRDTIVALERVFLGLPAIFGVFVFVAHQPLLQVEMNLLKSANRQFPEGLLLLSCSGLQLN